MTSYDRDGVSNRRQLQLFVQKLINFDIKENISAPFYWQLDSSHKGPVTWTAFPRRHHVDGLVQNCSNSIANTLELLQSCTEPSMWIFTRHQCSKDPDVQILHLYSTMWKYDNTWYVYWKQILKSESCDDANFSSLGAPQVVITTTSGATIDEKSGTMTRFQQRCQSYHYHTPQYRQKVRVRNERVDGTGTYRWFSAKLQQFQCVSNGVTAVLYDPFLCWYEIMRDENSKQIKHTFNGPTGLSVPCSPVAMPPWISHYVLPSAAFH